MEKFEDIIIKSYPTGSRYICNPAPKDTDNDTVILVNGFYDYDTILRDDGWEDCGPDYDNVGEFRAYRKGEENYIVTEDPEFYDSYVKATEGAKALNLLKKEDRIALFQAVCSASLMDTIHQSRLLRENERNEDAGRGNGLMAWVDRLRVGPIGLE